MSVLYTLTVAAAAGIGVIWLGLQNIRVVKQFERGVVFRFGRVQSRVRRPGLTMLIPIADRLQKVNMQIITMPVPAQDGITRDNVTVRVDAVDLFQGRGSGARGRRRAGLHVRRSGRSRRPRCGRSSARATWTICCPTASGSTRAWS